MNTAPGISTYKVLASDNLLYGPIDLDTLIQWTTGVLPETWIMRLGDGENAWIPARLISDLKPCFGKAQTEVKSVPALKAAAWVLPEQLRQFELFTAVSNEQLTRFLEFAEFVSADPGDLLIKKGDPGDAIYFLLSGTVRARLVIGGEEQKLATIPSGTFFGEIAMLTQNLRTADIVVSEPSRLLRMSAQALIAMNEQLPNVTSPIFFAMCRTLAGRLSDLTVQMSRDRASDYVWS
jgi:hypothetical protein